MPLQIPRKLGKRGTFGTNSAERLYVKTCSLASQALRKKLRANDTALFGVLRKLYIVLLFEMWGSFLLCLTTGGKLI